MEAASDRGCDVCFGSEVVRKTSLVKATESLIKVLGGIDLRLSPTDAVRLDGAIRYAWRARCDEITTNESLRAYSFRMAKSVRRRWPKSRLAKGLLKIIEQDKYDGWQEKWDSEDAFGHHVRLD